LTLVLPALLARAADEPAKTAGDVTLPVPAPGFAWKKVREIDAKGGGKVEVFAATKENSAARVVLIIEPAIVDTDAQKSARVKGLYNGTIGGLKEQGYTDLKGTKPPLTPPYTDRASFYLTGKGKDGQNLSFFGILVFGKSLYQLQVAAPTDDEAKALAKVADSIKE
jgi:hypothetical protein